jgi:ketosteroid isomerase-like protein
MLRFPQVSSNIIGADAGLFAALDARSPAMTEQDAVLAANLEFYRAFTAGDYPAMEKLWARVAPVLCIHPGWPPLLGRDAVMQSWRALLSGSERTQVMCHDDRAFLYGDFATVICEEELPNALLIATNLFAKEDGGWRMVHHQAGPILAGGYEEPPSRLH